MEAGADPGASSGAEIDVAVLFADVRGSTSLGERLGPVAFAALTNRFYRVATDALLKYDATIDKMVGDEVMALFVPGFTGPEYHRLAVQAAIDLIRVMGYNDVAGPWLPVGVGVHAGPAFVGSLGSGGVTDFTALGDTVNTAARLRSVAAGGEVVVSEALYDAASLVAPSGERRVLTLRGKAEGLEVCVLRPGTQPAGDAP